MIVPLAEASKSLIVGVFSEQKLWSAFPVGASKSDIVTSTSSRFVLSQVPSDWAA